MSKSLSSNRNLGKSLYQGGTNSVSRSDQFYIGIVDRVVDASDNDVIRRSDNPSVSDFMDDRYAIYVVPIDLGSNNVLNKCFMINSHNMDIPISGEAVLVMRSNVGNVIIDRFSPNAYGVNYELSDTLIQSTISSDSPFIELTKEAIDTIGIKGFSDVKPFDIKLNSKAFFGRNNQYFIMDYGSRKASDIEEEEYNGGSSNIRIGIKNSESQHVGKGDPTHIVLVENGKIQSLLDSVVESTFNPSYDRQGDNGFGVESDDLVFIGRQFVVIYSLQNMLISGERDLYIDFEQVILHSPKIKLGSEDARNPSVLGNELIEMMSELISVIQSMKHITPQGPTTGLTPDTIIKFEKLKSKYLRSNNSLIHSKKVFLE